MKRPTRSLRPDAIDSVIPTQEDFQFDLTERVRSAVQATIQLVLDEELERLVGAGPYERSDQRVDVRKGRYERHVVTTAGEVALALDARVPVEQRPRRWGGTRGDRPRSTTPEPWAAAMCATSRDDVWKLASEVARGSSKPVSPSTDECRERVRVATQHTVELQGQLGAPLVEFRGKLYRGYREVKQLEELLR